MFNPNSSNYLHLGQMGEMVWKNVNFWIQMVTESASVCLTSDASIRKAMGY